MATASPSPCSSPLFSPSSDKRFWRDMRSRVDTILEARNCDVPRETIAQTLTGGRSDQAKKLKPESLLLLRGFESIASSLSQLSGNLDNALQGARDLSKPPTFTEMLHSVSSGYQSDDKVNKPQSTEESDEQAKGLKRKFEQEQSEDCSDDDQEQEGKQLLQVNEKLNKAKNLAASMASRAAWLSRELKSVKSDLCFMQDRCTMLEEENKRLRYGFARGIRPEEDDLVSLQLEALLAEKSRLANENTNLSRENRCLQQLVEYHQLAAQDLPASYEQVMEGQCLDFSSPSSPSRNSVNEWSGDQSAEIKALRTSSDFEFQSCLDEER